MKAFLLLCVVALAGAFGLAGCSSSESRSTGTAPASGPLTAGSQPRPAREKARIGDTQAMVQSAMGDPDEKRDVTDGDGRQSIWIYKNYFQKAGRVEQTGWSEVLVPAVQDQYGTVTQKPVTQDIYHKQVVADIQVGFKDSVVCSVDQVRH